MYLDLFFFRLRRIAMPRKIDWPLVGDIITRVALVAVISLTFMGLYSETHPHYTERDLQSFGTVVTVVAINHKWNGDDALVENEHGDRMNIPFHGKKIAIGDVWSLKIDMQRIAFDQRLQSP